MSLTPEESIFAVRRSIHVNAAPERVWDEFSSFARMNTWWGIVTGEPQAGTSKGQWLEVYEPWRGGRIRMAVNSDGSRVAYGGEIKRFEPATELTFENDWIPNRGWRAPTLITIRLKPAPVGTMVELFHYGFELIGDDAGATHAGYEAGWGMTQLAELKRIVEAAA
jgi:uncharacterized protein YndB with AHSA1/START domain